jgi:hypothetical protein
MKASLSILLATFLAGSSLLQAEPANIASDDTAQDAYSGGWPTDKAGGGFSAWTHRTSVGGGADTYAGFFIASKDKNPDIKGAGVNDKAFGLFANGAGAEAAVAFRSFDKSLAVGDTFSCTIQVGGTMAKKSSSDEGAPGEIGFTLRTGSENGITDDYNKGERFQFVQVKDTVNYQIRDGGDSPDSGVAVTDGGVTVKVTLTSPDAYDLEIVTLNDAKSTKLTGRKLAGAAGSAIDSFCIFNRNGESSDGYFNSFSVTH